MRGLTILSATTSLNHWELKYVWCRNGLRDRCSAENKCRVQTEILFNEKIKSLSPWPPLPHSIRSQPPHAWPLSSSAILSSSASVKTIILHVDTIPHTSQHDQQVSSVSGVRSEGTGDVIRSGPELPGSWSQVSAHGQQEHEWNK